MADSPSPRGLDYHANRAGHHQSARPRAHPIEGGFFRETYRSAGSIPAAALPAGYHDDRVRSYGTAIYYLLTTETFSELHRLPTEEVFHFYLGSPVRMLQIFPDGHVREIILEATSSPVTSLR